MPSVFLAVFSAGRAVEAFSTFVVASFFVEVASFNYKNAHNALTRVHFQYNAPVVTTSFVVTLGAGVMLSFLQDVKEVFPKLMKHVRDPHRLNYGSELYNDSSVVSS